MRSLFKTRRELALENLALRQQIGVLTQTRGDRRLLLGKWDRGFWVVLSHGWTGWREALACDGDPLASGRVPAFLDP